MKTIRIRGAVKLQFEDGSTLIFSPAKPAQARSRTLDAKQGRPPSPATLALRAELEKNKVTGTVRSRAEYLQLLRDAGYKGSPSGAYLIVRREVRNILGKAIPKATKRPKSGPARRGGRRAGTETELLRKRLAQDSEGSGIRDASHYVRWLVDQNGVSKGLKQLRPIVYREMRALGRAKT